MNESYERSYYEVALTNNQVLSALAVLLICLLAAFVAGMWVAKEAVAGEPTLVAQVDQEGGVSDESTEAEAGLFRFFKRAGNGESAQASSPAEDNSSVSAEQQSPQSRETTSEAPPEESPSRVVRNIRPVEVAPSDSPRSAERRTPAEPTGEGPSRVAVAKPSEQSPAEERTSTAAQQRPARTSPRATGDDRESADTRVAERAQPTPTAAVDADPEAESEQPRIGEMLVVQVLSSADQEQAGKVVVQLKDSGYRAFLSPAQVEGRTMYRVRVGPYSDRAQAEEASDKIKRAFRLNTWITARS